MPTGLIITHSNGRQEFGLTTRLFRVLGRSSTTAVNGSLYVPEFALGIGRVAPNSREPTVTGMVPRLYVSGMYVVWEFDTYPATHIPIPFTFGVEV